MGEGLLERQVEARVLQEQPLEWEELQPWEEDLLQVGFSFLSNPLEIGAIRDISVLQSQQSL